MKTAIVYLYVAGKSDPSAPEPETYHPWSARFIDYYQRGMYPLTVDLVVVICGGDVSPAHRELFHMADRFIEYSGSGWDVGAHQHAMHVLKNEYDFAINCATPVYFKDNTFVARMVDAAESFGDGLYGPMASFQISPHIRTCCWACRPMTLAQYPHFVTTRENTFEAESGKKSITKYYIDRGMPTMMVAASGCYGKGDWRSPKNIFRRGDQSNCLAWDRHCDIYDAASVDDKAVLEALADGKLKEARR